jgi:hypothetical protein
MTTTIKLTNRWQTICTVGYTGGVSRDENRSAHGGVCHCQARRAKTGEIMGRKVNSNGRHEEVGEPFAIDEERVRHWAAIGG